MLRKLSVSASVFLVLVGAPAYAAQPSQTRRKTLPLGDVAHGKK